MALNARQTRFVEEYLVDLNATQAAIRSGYSAKTAQPASSRLLLNVMVQSEINKRRTKQSAQMEINVASITSRLMIIADKAEAMDSPAAYSVARQSVMDVAKLNGLVVESSETIVRSPNERAARLAELRSERERLTRTH